MAAAHIDQPVDPYHSFVVSASAGTGKTYQLSQRYLRLVAAGAEPAEILTVTFTRKAAAEMKERIFADAMQVLSDPQAARALDAEMRDHLQRARRQHPDVRQPRNAHAAAEAILTQSQSLKIQTIDSLFQELVQRFPVEAGEHVPIPFRIAETVEMQEILEKAYQRLFEDADTGDQAMATLLESYLTYPDAGVHVLRDALDYLRNERLFLWELQQRHGLSWDDFLLDPGPDYGDFSGAELRETLADMVVRAGDMVGLKTGDKIIAAAHDFAAGGDIAALKDALFKKSGIWEFPQAVLNKVEAPLTDAILDVCYELWRRRLNEHAQVTYRLYARYEQVVQTLKQQAGLVDFDDLSMGVYNLFYSAESFGARYHLFLRVSHLLIDEFQDTSRVQWDIFAAMAEELLAGRGVAAERGIVPTVFLVGDAKQSIYAFRQGDYRLLDEAATHLAAQFGVKRVALDRSWRSSNLILDQVNRVFSAPAFRHLLPDFNHHETAAPGGEPVVPPSGLFALLQTPAPAKGESAGDARRKEGEQLAALIDSWVAARLPVYDRRARQFRALQYRDIGVLYRRSRQAEELEIALIRRGIPYTKEERRGYYTRREVEDITAFLTFLARPNDDIAVATLLRSPLLRLSDDALMAMLADRLAASTANASQPSLFAMLATTHPQLHALLQEAQQQIGRRTIDHILLHFLEETSAFAAYRLAWGEKEGQLAQANLQQLVEIVGTAIPRGSGSILEYLDMLKEFRGVDETGNAQLAADSVTLMTMHKAKGLEFPVVILAGAEDGLVVGGGSDAGFRKSLAPEAKPLVYIGRKKDEHPPATPAMQRLLRQFEDEARKEGMRLLYVALTRAQLYFVASAAKVSGTEAYYNILDLALFRDAGSEPAFGQRQDGELAPGVRGTYIAAWPPPLGEPPAPEKTADSASARTPPDFAAAMPAAGIRMQRHDAVISPAGDDLNLDVRAREVARFRDRAIRRAVSGALRSEAPASVETLAGEARAAGLELSDKELAALHADLQQHSAATLACAALQAIRQDGARMRTSVPFLLLQDEVLHDSRIDLLAVSAKTAWAIAYWTAPSGQGAAVHPEQEARLRAMAAAVARLYPGKAVRCALLLTASGELVEWQDPEPG